MKIGIDSILLGAWCPVANRKKILDIGSGTGILPLMLAQRSDASIEAIEIETSAFKESLENFKASPFKNQITAHHCALQDFSPDHSFDLIISNPPYFNASLLSEDTKRNTARQQTTLSYEDFLDHSKRLLQPDGKLVFILPSSSISAISAYAKKQHLYINTLTMVYGIRGKSAKRTLFILQKTPCNTIESDFFIRESDNKYSEAFQELTQNFYLKSHLER